MGGTAGPKGSDEPVKPAKGRGGNARPFRHQKTRFMKPRAIFKVNARNYTAHAVLPDIGETVLLGGQAGYRLPRFE